MKELQEGELFPEVEGREAASVKMQQLVIEYGWLEEHAVLDPEANGFEEATLDAIDYMADYVPDGCYIDWEDDTLHVMRHDEDPDEEAKSLDDDDYDDTVADDIYF